MKQILKYILLLGLVLSSCVDNADEPAVNLPSDENILSLNISVANGNASSRVVDEGLVTLFEEGDSVGVIVLDKNNEFIVNNALFVLKDKWTYTGERVKTPYFDSEMDKYIVYYPYDDRVTAAKCKSIDDLLATSFFPHNEDQTGTYAYRQSDVMAWTSSGSAIKNIEAKLKHLRNSVSVDILVQWKLLTDEIISFKLPNDVSLFDKDGKLLKHYQADDGSFRYILPDGYDGDVTYLYNYRESMFKGRFTVPADVTGTCQFKYEVADMGTYDYDKVIVSDFYCKNMDNIGYVLPCEANSWLDNENHRCIGLVFYTGQHELDGDEGRESFDPEYYTYDYTDTGIGEESCHGYVMALTDVQNDSNNQPFTIDANFLPLIDGSYLPPYYTNQQTNDWGGYSNCKKILQYANDLDGYVPEQFPAIFGCLHYGRLGVKFVEDWDGEEYGHFVEVTDSVPGNPYSWQWPLSAPDNTTGWFLPALGQIRILREYEALFEERYKQIKDRLSDDVPYKEHIRWFLYKIGRYYYYWTTTQAGEFEDRTFTIEFSYENFAEKYLKSRNANMRAVLAY